MRAAWVHLGGPTLVIGSKNRRQVHFPRTASTAYVSRCRPATLAEQRQHGETDHPAAGNYGMADWRGWPQPGPRRTRLHHANPAAWPGP